jgi:hypothetical protein
LEPVFTSTNNKLTQHEPRRTLIHWSAVFVNGVRRGAVQSYVPRRPRIELPSFSAANVPLRGRAMMLFKLSRCPLVCWGLVDDR